MSIGFGSRHPYDFWLTSPCRENTTFWNGGIRHENLVVYLLRAFSPAGRTPILLAEHTGQHKGGLFFLLIGIQLLVAAALISGHREEQTAKSQTSTDGNEAEPIGGNASGEQEKKS